MPYRLGRGEWGAKGVGAKRGIWLGSSVDPLGSGGGTCGGGWAESRTAG